MTPIAHLDALEAALTSKGFPAMSAWWKGELRRFYASGRRQLVVRAGRRAGKSSTLCRVAVLEALYGEHRIPPGDVGVVAIVSVSRDEASGRLRTVKAILDAIGVKWRPVDGGIELCDRPFAFKVFAASVAGVSGFTAICVICDEVAKWRDSDTGSNPATEVLASLRPTLAGNPNARIFLSSSPLGSDDAHARAFDRGDDDFQAVAFAETWVARPSLTEADCRALETDPDLFVREYGCIPFSGSTSALLTDAQIRAVSRLPLVIPREDGVTYYAAQDPANRGGNGWTLAIARARTVDELTSVQVVCAREWRASKGGALDSDRTMGEIAEVLSGYGVTDLHTDQWSFDALASIASRHRLALRMSVSTQTTKVQHADALRRRIADRTVELPDDPQVRADLLGVRKWISRNGAFSIELERSGGRHSDFAPAIMHVVALAAEEAGGLPAWASPAGLAGMRRFMHGGDVGNGWAYDPVGDPDFGRHTPKGPEPIVVSRNNIGQLEAFGMAPQFQGQWARWSRPTRTTPQFSAAATPDFRKAVAAYIEANPC